MSFRCVFDLIAGRDRSGVLSEDDLAQEVIAASMKAGMVLDLHVGIVDIWLLLGGDWNHGIIYQ